MITHVTEANYQEEVKNHSGRVLIDFYTNTCPPCRMLAPVLEEIDAEQGDKLKIVKIDAGSEFDLATEYGVSAVPTLVLVKDGAKAAQTTGFRSKKDLVKWLDASVGS